MEEEDDTMTVTVTNPSSEGTKGFYSPDEVTIERTLLIIVINPYMIGITLHLLESSSLVIPVVIPGNEHRVQKIHWIS